MQTLEDYHDAQVGDDAYEDFMRGRSLEESIEDLLQHEDQ